jgi:hypothetical protein
MGKFRSGIQDGKISDPLKHRGSATLKERQSLMLISNLPVHLRRMLKNWLKIVKDCLSFTKCFFLQVPAPVCKWEKGAVQKNTIDITECKLQKCVLNQGAKKTDESTGTY